MRNFHELYTLSLVRLMKSSTFGLDSLATVCLLHVFKPGLKSNFCRYQPLKNSLLKQEIIGNFFNWDFTQSTPFPPSIQLYPSKFSTTVITWLILYYITRGSKNYCLSTHIKRDRVNVLSKLDYQPLFGKWARAVSPTETDLSVSSLGGLRDRRKSSLLLGFWTFLI